MTIGASIVESQLEINNPYFSVSQNLGQGRSVFLKTLPNLTLTVIIVSSMQAGGKSRGRGSRSFRQNPLGGHGFQGNLPGGPTISGFIAFLVF